MKEEEEKKDGYLLTWNNFETFVDEYKNRMWIKYTMV